MSEIFGRKIHPLFSLVWHFNCFSTISKNWQVFKSTNIDLKFSFQLVLKCLECWTNLRISLSELCNEASGPCNLNCNLGHVIKNYLSLMGLKILQFVQKRPNFEHKKEYWLFFLPSKRVICKLRPLGIANWIWLSDSKSNDEFGLQIQSDLKLKLTRFQLKTIYFDIFYQFHFFKLNLTYFWL